GDDYLKQSLLADVVFGPYQRVEVVPMPMPSLPAFHGVFERQVNRTRGRVNSHERTARNEIRPPRINSRSIESVRIKTESEAGIIGAASVKRENEVKRHIHAVDVPRLRVYRTVAVNIEADLRRPVERPIRDRDSRFVQNFFCHRSKTKGRTAPAPRY